MKYVSNDGRQMVEAVQFNSRDSIKDIEAMGIDAEPALAGIIINNQFVAPGQFIISTMCATVIKDSKTFINRFRPVIVQDELF